VAGDLTNAPITGTDPDLVANRSALFITRLWDHATQTVISSDAMGYDATSSMSLGSRYLLINFNLVSVTISL
jgi:hypothetical protein